MEGVKADKENYLKKRTAAIATKLGGHSVLSLGICSSYSSLNRNTGRQGIL